MELLPAMFLKTTWRNICFYAAFLQLNIIVLFLIFTDSLFDSCALFQAFSPSSPINCSGDSMLNSHHQVMAVGVGHLDLITQDNPFQQYFNTAMQSYLDERIVRERTVCLLSYSPTNIPTNLFRNFLRIYKCKVRNLHLGLLLDPGTNQKCPMK